MRLNPYLMFNGDCEAAFTLYARVTGGKITSMLPYEGSPAAGHAPPEWQKKILHARIQIGEDTIMGSDASPGHYNKPQGSSVTLRVDTPEEAERAFKGLADGATIQMPMDKTFFANQLERAARWPRSFRFRPW